MDMMLLEQTGIEILASKIQSQRPLVMGERFVQEFPRLTADEISRFAKEIGDQNPIHHFDGIARSVNFLGRIATTVQIFGYLSATVAERCPLAIVRDVHIRPKTPLYADSLPVVECEVTTIRGPLVRITARVKNGYELVANCTAILKPSK